MAAPPNPFLPPDLSGDDAPAPLELSDVPKRPQPAAPRAEIDLDTSPVIPPPRPAVSYKNPDAAGRTVLVLLLAAGGLGVVFLGIKLLRGKGDSRPVQAQGQLAAPAPAPEKPVVWRALAKGDDVLVTVEVEPRTARGTTLLLDGNPLPSNPVSLPRGSEHRIAATAPGHEPDVVAFTADAPRSVKLTLRRARR
jgi:hypothetical protein